MNLTRKSILPANTSEASVIALLWGDLASKYPPGLLELALLVATQILFFWIPATALLLLDLNYPEFSNRNKIQSERHQPTWPQIKHCINHVAINSINGTVVQFFVSYFLGFQKSIYRVSPDLPSSTEMVFDLFIALVVREVMFYYSHRALHHPSIYKHIHK
jgi:sterol desaturase/sphingolipid hydroxylase (fatty acid hydroxylase superfamily)